MQFSLEKGPGGRLVCTLTDGEQETTVTASNVPAAGDDLLAALDDARDAGYGECLWEEPTGQYRWMFRRHDDQVTVAVMWSSGTIMGWQHVFRTDCAFAPFMESVQTQVAGTV